MIQKKSFLTEVQSACNTNPVNDSQTYDPFSLVVWETIGNFML